MRKTGLFILLVGALARFSLGIVTAQDMPYAGTTVTIFGAYTEKAEFKGRFKWPES